VPARARWCTFLLGLLAPDSGELRIDGKDTRHAMRIWQDQIG